MRADAARLQGGAWERPWGEGGTPFAQRPACLPRERDSGWPARPGEASLMGATGGLSVQGALCPRGGRTPRVLLVSPGCDRLPRGHPVSPAFWVGGSVVTLQGCDCQGRPGERAPEEGDSLGREPWRWWLGSAGPDGPGQKPCNSFTFYTCHPPWVLVVSRGGI